MSIREKWEKALLEGQYSPSKTNRASRMGYNCLRRHYYERVHPEEKTPFSMQALATMNEGTIQEKNVRKHLMDLGYDITRSQEPFEFKDLNLTGHWEGFLAGYEKDPLLFEIKTTLQWTFDSLNSIDDFYNNRWWLGYLKQVTCYMRAAEVDKVLFIVKDRASWRIKEFMYHYEDKFWSEITTKCDLLNKMYVKEGVVPPDDECDYSECDTCPFLNYCCPDGRVISHEGFARVNDEDEIALIGRYDDVKNNMLEIVSSDYESLKSGKDEVKVSDLDGLLVPKKQNEKELKILDKTIKQKYHGSEGIFFGDEFELIGEMVNRKGYKVDDTEYWKKTVRRL